MRKSKRLWTVLVAALTMVLCLNAAVAEDETFKAGDFEYRILEDGTAEITEYSGKNETLDIPETLDGKTVTSIGEDAFWSCRSLVSIVIPESVTQIEESPFVGCESLKNVSVSPENTTFAGIDGVLFNKTDKTLICYPAGKGETTYEIPQEIRSIGACAFYGCSSLESVTIPNSVTSIGDGAFRECGLLTNITIPDSVMSIGGAVFDSPMLTVSRDSSAEQYAQYNDLRYTYNDANE